MTRSRRKSSGVHGKSSDVRGKSSGVHEKSAGVHEQSLSVHGKSSGVRGKSSGVRGKSSSVHGKASGARGEPAGLWSVNRISHTLTGIVGTLYPVESLLPRGFLRGRRCRQADEGAFHACVSRARDSVPPSGRPVAHDRSCRVYAPLICLRHLVLTGTSWTLTGDIEDGFCEHYQVLGWCWFGSAPSDLSFQ